MVMDRKIKRFVIMGIALVTLLEMYFAYRAIIDYNGTYQVWIFIPLLLQPVLYQSLLGKEVSHYKARVIILGLVSFLFPLMIYFTLPNYTYADGKQIVEQHLGQNKDIVFTEFAFDMNTVPVIDNPKQLFVSAREYYYEVASKDGSRYFIVSPITGKITQLHQGYWPEGEAE